MFNPLAHPICFAPIQRLAPSTWIGHTPFAMFLTEVLRPKTFVELGTYYGTSFCAFCQAVKTLNIDTQCYAVDTWEGDSQSGFFGNEVLHDLKTYHDKIYGGFSRLIQSTFDNALTHFGDKTIDLLHIDGFHTYEAVKNDFDKWLPKMSGRGVILFHDINVKERDFGVWKFWDEIKVKYPGFEFFHSHGLGVIAVGSNVPKNFLDFLTFANKHATLVRDFFYQIGNRFEAALEIADLKKALESQAGIISTLQNKEPELSENNQQLEIKLARISEQEQQLKNQQLQFQENEQKSLKRFQEEREKWQLQVRDREKRIGLKENELSTARTKLTAAEKFIEQQKEQIKTEKQKIFAKKLELEKALLEVNNGEFSAKYLNKVLEKQSDNQLSGQKKLKFIIGVVTYNNSPEQLEHLLKSVSVAVKNVTELNTDFEIFVIDNGEETFWDDSEIKVAKFESLGNIGFGKGMNHLMSRAFADAKTEWFLCLNPDGALHYNALNELIKAVRLSPSSLIEARQFPEEHPKKYDLQTLETPWASGACLLIPKNIYEKTGGFDPNFFMYMEDVDFSWRARSYGFSIKVAPNALFAHSVLDRDFSESTDKYCLLSGRYLAHKWKNADFIKWTEKELIDRGYFTSKDDLPDLPKLNPERESKKDVSTFKYYFHFSPARW